VCSSVSSGYDLLSAIISFLGGDLISVSLAAIAETGADLSCFPTVGHLTRWRGLCPGTKITGGKVMSGKTKHVANRAAQALQLAAAANRHWVHTFADYART
jgi:transposase